MVAIPRPHRCRSGLRPRRPRNSCETLIGKLALFQNRNWTRLTTKLTYRYGAPVVAVRYSTLLYAVFQAAASSVATLESFSFL